LLTGADVLAPVLSQCRSPHPDCGKETILSTASANEQQHSTHRTMRLPIVGTAGAFLEQRNFARLGERDAVEQLGDDHPCPEALICERVAEPVGIGDRSGERDERRQYEISAYGGLKPVEH
jgi:hypothetical protein